MPVLQPATTKQSGKIIGWFLLFWTVLNALQSATLGLHSDEAYYWVYAQLLDWGYYDHPPMVALFIRLGDMLIPQNELGVRLVTVITSTVSVWLLWLIAKKYRVEAKWFVVIFLSIFIFHIYGFTVTPDAPLLFFTVLFYYLYQQYLLKNSWPLALLLAVVVACLLYSKYHAILLLGFTVITNIRLCRRLTFWVIILLAVLLYIPHIWWQVQNGYPSVNYHLFERSSQVYQFAHTYLFIPGQLLMAGPLIGWFLFYYAYGVRVKDAFIRCLIVNGAGTLLFFLTNTVKGNVQPHWTLIAFVPLLLLTLIRLKQAGARPIWLYRLAIINAALVVVFRLMMITGLPFITKINFLKSYYGYREWAQQIKQKAGDAYIMIPMGFQTPSKYNYYTRSIKAMAYDQPSYRRTQYDLWPIEDSLQNRRTYWLQDSPPAGLNYESIHTVKNNWYGSWVNHTRTYQKVYVRTKHYTLKARQGQKLSIPLTVTNPYKNELDFSNGDNVPPVFFEACFIQEEETRQRTPAGEDFNQLRLAPGASETYVFALTAPKEKGAYELIFSLRTTPFPGGRNSRIINFLVE